MDTGPEGEGSSSNSNITQGIEEYCNRLLPLRVPGKYYPPYDIASLLVSHTNFKIGNVRVSRASVMKHVIKAKYILCKMTTLYKLCKLLLSGSVLKDTSWAELE